MLAFSAPRKIVFISRHIILCTTYLRNVHKTYLCANPNKIRSTTLVSCSSQLLADDDDTTKDHYIVQFIVIPVNLSSFAHHYRDCIYCISKLDIYIYSFHHMQCAGKDVHQTKYTMYYVYVYLVFIRSSFFQSARRHRRSASRIEYFSAFITSSE